MVNLKRCKEMYIFKLTIPLYKVYIAQTSYFTSCISTLINSSFSVFDSFEIGAIENSFIKRQYIIYMVSMGWQDDSCPYGHLAMNSIWSDGTQGCFQNKW